MIRRVIARPPSCFRLVPHLARRVAEAGEKTGAAAISRHDSAGLSNTLDIPNGASLSRISVFLTIIGGFMLRLTKLLLKAVLALFMWQRAVSSNSYVPSGRCGRCLRIDSLRKTPFARRPYFSHRRSWLSRLLSGFIAGLCVRVMRLFPYSLCRRAGVSI